MKSFIKFLAITFLLTGVALQSKASHISGGSIKYKSLGSNQWYIEAAVFRDCSGATYSSFTETLDVECVPTAVTSVQTVTHLAFVAPTPAPFGGPYAGVTITQGSNTLIAEEISDVCDNILNPNTTPTSRCRSAGGAQGYLRFKFSTILTLTPCAWQRIGFEPVCCRNNAGSNISTSSMYVHTFFNSLNFPTNSAPDFADEVKPIPSACIGKKVLYGIGTIDNDGDSLRFELDCALGVTSGVVQCANYNGGFSATAPASGLIMDSATGLIEFTPTTGGKRVVAFWVKEYERCTGVLKAQTLRDVQFRIETCSNNVPRDVSGISNIQGDNYTRIGDYQLEVCNGEYISWEDTIVDIDSGITTIDTLLFQSNFDKVLPGATMSINYLSRTKAVVRWNWRATIGLNPVKIFYLVFNDNYCQYPGNGFSVFEINVRNSTNAGRDTAVCAGDTVRLDAAGGKLYQWKSVWGDSLYYSGPNQNVWSDTTAVDTNRTMKFLPSKTTLLEVWSDLQQGCVKAQACSVRDSIQITVADTFRLSITNDTLICFNDSSIQLNVTPNKLLPTYSYKWNDSRTLDYDSIGNPIATPLTDKKYHVTVTSDSGCVRLDSMNLRVTPPFPDNIIATASDTVICKGAKSYLSLEMGYRPTSCGLTQGACSGASQDLTIGTDTTRNAATGSGFDTWPTPYGNLQKSARQQYLFRASELSAASISNGIIQGISFYVDEIKGTTNYGGYTIKMGCTNLSSLTGLVTSGLGQVYNPKTYVVQQGWNYHPFDIGYDYDGTSNLLIEICYLNSGTSENCRIRYTTTSYSSVRGATAASGACAIPIPSLFNDKNRPNIKFNVCQAPDPMAYKYTWTPSKFLNTDTIYNPIASITDSITYQAFVQDTFNKCSGTSTKIHLDLIKLDVSKDTILCPFDTISVNVNTRTSCPGDRFYRWTASDTSAYISNDTIANPRLMATVNTEFYLTFGDTCGCNINDTFRINMRALPDPVVTPNPPSCGFDNGSIQITGVGGLTPYSYTLVGGGKNLANSNGMFNNLNNGYYTIRVTDAGKCFREFIDTFTNDAPIIDSITTKDLDCFNAGNGEINIFASQGVGQLSYSINPSSSFIPNNPVFTGLDSGKYTVVVQSASNPVCQTKPIEVTLWHPDSLYADLYYSEVTCNGDADAWAHGVAVGGVTPYNYQWGNGSTRDSALRLSGGPDSLILTDANNCTFVKNITIQEYPKVVVDSIVHKNGTCNGTDDGQIEIYARGGKQALFYTRNQGATYSQISSFNKLEPETYFIRVKDINDCSVFDTITVIEPPEVQLTSTYDSTTICVSTCADMIVNATGGNSAEYSYQWIPGISSTVQAQRVCPEESTTYWVYAQDTAGCISLTRKIRVELFDSLSVEMPENRTVCLNENTQLPVTAAGGDGRGFIYDWSPKLGINDPNLPNPLASPGEPTTYTVTVRDQCGSPSVSNSMTVEVLPLPVVNFDADVVEACHPAKIIYTNTSPKQGVNCIWDFGNGIEFYGCNQAPSFYKLPGLYDVTLSITDEHGCRDSLTKESFVNVLRSPIPLFDWEPKKPTTQNPDVQFVDKSLIDIQEWNWTFGTFATSEEQHPELTFPETHQDRYPVKLEVTAPNGCTSDTVYNVEIGPEFSLFIPKAFSPNGDGINDVFKPIGKGIDFNQYQMFVYNRWGELLFESSDYADGWDGKDSRSGEFMKAGVYPYRFLIGDTFDEAERHEYRGTVTIVYTEKQ